MGGLCGLRNASRNMENNYLNRDVTTKVDRTEMEGSSLSVRKGAWTEEEDILLKKCIEKYGEGKWHQVPSRAGLNRCRKSCRLRWLNYLNPNIKRGAFAADEVDLIIRLHNLLGNRWSLIAGRLPGRTANDVKNYWNTHLLKKKVDLSSNPNPRQNTSEPVPIVIRPRPQILSNNSFPVMLEENKKNNTAAAAATPASNSILVSANSGNSSSYCFSNENDEIMRWENVMMNENEVDYQQQGSINNINLSVLGDLPIIEEMDSSTTSNFQLLHVAEEDNYDNLDDLFLDVDLWNVFNP